MVKVAEPVSDRVKSPSARLRKARLKRPTRLKRQTPKHAQNTRAKTGTYSKRSLPGKQDRIGSEQLGDSNRTGLFSVQIYTRVLRLTAKYWLVGLLAFIGAAMFSVSVVLVADLMQFILDALGDQLEPDNGIVSGWTLSALGPGAAQDSALIRTILPFIMLFLVLMRGTGNVMSSYCLSYVSSAVSHDFRCMLFRKILSMPAFVLTEKGSGFVLNTLGAKVDMISGTINGTLLVLLRSGTTVIGLVAYLLYINWQLSLIFFTIIPPIIYSVRKGARRINSYARRAQRAVTVMGQMTTDTMLGFKEIQMFHGRSSAHADYSFISDYSRRQGLHMAAISALLQPLLQILLAIALSVLVWMAMDPDGIANMTSGQFTSYLVAAGLISAPARSLSGILGSLQRAMVASNDVFAMLDSAPELDKGHYSVTRARGRVEFRDVSFRYEQTTGKGDVVIGNDVLKGLNFLIAPGKMVAVVGRTGSGKSTMMSLLMRFLLPQRGVILLDDMDISEYQLDVYRRQLAVVLQHNFMFNATIYDNITYGCSRHKSRAEVEEVARAAYITEFSDKLPKGLETRIGVGGQQLSGGQQQRVAIARALLKDAPVLLMDEATSSLDNETEHHVQRAMRELCRGRTTFVIAHRLTTVEHADAILVLDKGVIVESGTHSDLLAKNGLYAKLYHKNFED